MNTSIDAPISHFIDLLLDAVCMADADGRFVYASPACEQIFGYTQQEMIGRRVMDMVLPADRERTMVAAQAVKEGRSHVNFENRYVRKDGGIVHIMWSARWSDADQLRVAVARDVTAVRQAEAMREALYALSEAAHASEDLDGLFERCHAIIGTLLPAPEFFVALTDQPDRQLRMAFHAGADGGADGLAPLLCAHVLRTNAPLLLDAGTTAALPGALGAAAAAMTGSALAVPLTSPEGAVGVLGLRNRSSGARYGSAERNLLLFVANQLADAIQRKRLHARLRFLAMHDELTGLPNRRLLRDRLDTALGRARRKQGRLALLFIDLDRFKEVNDRHGHACGDRLLRQVAARLGAAVRDTDTLARVGGDEFVILLEDMEAPRDVELVVTKIRAALASPFELDGAGCLQVSASIGVAHYPDQCADLDALIDAADAAMYAAKARNEA